ncbi:hypothetical protein VOLCADRAFT_90942 [Volvox carteri f. nagariensis]|uniref:Uncharacterized protein n=1 Tax=Volvox carteri f. nagariensis TaxID=3068 RepID=D8TVS6_VOLCA|nr:uncharacterized protein VOLCADRAFT_90942 [Volvox carteri f. nagariensis]EFJ48355.1 hypothetical protein VOLCADRAFT_90942 [Volvox carteri f. nagariensis]|eukprot:XP_002950609.1 hypothetical protein VOLCADRAFT_90942 [Volvox carteri f. nagariensis]
MYLFEHYPNLPELDNFRPLDPPLTNLVLGMVGCPHLAPPPRPPRQAAAAPKAHQQTQQHQQAQQPQPYNRKPRFRLLPEDPNDRQRPEDNPSLDDIVLDEQYYKEMGLTKEEVWEALRQLDATEVDPEGVNLGSSGLQAWPPSADNSGAPLRNHRTNPLNSAATSTRQEARSDHNMPQLQRQPHWIRGSVQDDGEYKSRGATDVDDELEDEGQEEEEEGQDDDEEEEEEEEGAWAEQQQRGDRLSEESTLQPPLGGPVLGLGPGSIDVEAEEEGEVYGPEAVVLAGFRPEEHGVVRALLDSAGGHVVKVLPVTEAMLYGTVDEAVQSGEQDWSAPRPLGGPRGGGWGAQRTVLFSGLSRRLAFTSTSHRFFEREIAKGLPPLGNLLGQPSPASSLGSASPTHPDVQKEGNCSHTVTFANQPIHPLALAKS